MNLIVEQLLVDFVIRSFFVFGLVALLVGVGLFLNQERMHRIFATANRWVSTRRGTRWLAIPRDDVESVAHRFRRQVGAVFVLGAAYSTFVLMTQVDVQEFGNALRGGEVSPALAAWMAESVRWLLIAGGMVAIAAGALLMFAPDALRLIEHRANHWYSTHNWTRGGDEMHMGLDGWAESRPRMIGGLIAAGALVVVANFGMMLLARG